MAGKVERPERTFPRALAVAVVPIAVNYLLPLMAATGATDVPPDTWVNGYLADAAGTYKCRLVSELLQVVLIVVGQKFFIILFVLILLCFLCFLSCADTNVLYLETKVIAIIYRQKHRISMYQYTYCRLLANKYIYLLPPLIFLCICA